MQSNLLLKEFKNIISDISDSEALKYLQMGKGNLNLALNYFFNSQNKMANRLQQQEKSKNVFSELMEGSRNQSKLEKIFQTLKQDYNKPIQSAVNNKPLENKEIKHKLLDLNTGNFQETPKKLSFPEKKNQIDTEKPSQGFIYI